MVKGTTAAGKRQTITHIRCRRCGRHSYNIRTKVCSACGYGKSSKIRNQKWKNKTIGKRKRKK